MSVLSASGSPTPSQADEYSNALLDLLGDEDSVEVLQGTPAALRQSLDGFPATALRTPEAPGKWSAAMVIAPLSDSELVGAFRLRMILAHARTGRLHAGHDVAHLRQLDRIRRAVTGDTRRGPK